MLLLLLFCYCCIAIALAVLLYCYCDRCIAIAVFLLLYCFIAIAVLLLLLLYCYCYCCIVFAVAVLLLLLQFHWQEIPQIVGGLEPGRSYVNLQASPLVQHYRPYTLCTRMRDVTAAEATIVLANENHRTVHRLSLQTI